MLKPLFRPIDIAPLVYFRILGGSLITIEIIGEWLTDYSTNYTQPEFHFSYVLFEWLKPWPPAGIHIHFLINICMGVFVTLGLFYRFSAAILFLGTFSLFLMEKAVYINHTYLYCLVSFLMIFIPANRAFSLEVIRNPSIQSSSAPAWTLYILLFQIGVVHLFAGIAKLDGDWLMARPMQVWLAGKGDYPIYGWLLAQPWTPFILSRGGLMFDLLIIPAMLWARTRKYAFIVSIFFHLTNVLVFFIGTFPWFSIVMTSLFFPPGSFRKLPILRDKLPEFKPVDYYFESSSQKKRLTAFALGTYMVIQIFLPLRHWLYPGNPGWTEEGHTFAWRMMLRSKRGLISFWVFDPENGKRWRESPRHYLTSYQYRDMVGKPDMMLEFAHFLQEKYRKEGYPDVKVRAISRVSLNGRPYQAMVDPRLDLVSKKRSLRHYDWILPLKKE